MPESEAVGWDSVQADQDVYPLVTMASGWDSDRLIDLQYQRDESRFLVYWNGEPPTEAADLIELGANSNIVVDVVSVDFSDAEYKENSQLLWRALEEDGFIVSSMRPALDYSGSILVEARDFESGEDLSESEQLKTQARKVAATVVPGLEIGFIPFDPGEAGVELDLDSSLGIVEMQRGQLMAARRSDSNPFRVANSTVTPFVDQLSYEEETLSCTTGLNLKMAGYGIFS